MNRKETEKIKDSIRNCVKRLQTIKPYLSDEKITLNETFNRLLIEKAVLRHRLTYKEPSFLDKIIKKVKKNKRELICDYFN